jgi:hypothetical protein
VSASTPDQSIDAQSATAQLAGTIGALLTLIDQETTLLRAGQVRQAAALDARKGDLARSYVADSARVAAGRQHLATTAPNELRVLADLHRELQARLKLNMTVLATAHAVSEGVIRGVSEELTRKSVPTTYGAAGRATVPSQRSAQPLAVSRSI